MEYMVCMEQYGEGCDYMIACGKDYRIVEAESVEEVIEKVIWPDGREEYAWMLEGEDELEEMIIIPLSKIHKVDLEQLKKDYKDAQNKTAQDEKEAEEKAELERLKQKYEEK